MYVEYGLIIFTINLMNLKFIFKSEMQLKYQTYHITPQNTFIYYINRILTLVV